MGNELWLDLIDKLTCNLLLVQLLKSLTTFKLMHIRSLDEVVAEFTHFLLHCGKFWGLLGNIVEERILE